MRKIKLNHSKIDLIANLLFCKIIIERVVSLKIKYKINKYILKSKSSVKNKEKNSILILNKIKLFKLNTFCTIRCNCKMIK